MNASDENVDIISLLVLSNYPRPWSLARGFELAVWAYTEAVALLHPFPVLRLDAWP